MGEVGLPGREAGVARFSASRHPADVHLVFGDGSRVRDSNNWSAANVIMITSSQILFDAADSSFEIVRLRICTVAMSLR